ncbi:MAG: hypothetical protein QM699_07635 [Amaricoccus sp.]|uniref:hypothetical protein n=1 Tax=Amaricoccus sp. TaxID=1872485 RepID=UPI0039E3BB70
MHPVFIARRVAGIIERSAIDVTTEFAAQRGIREALERDGIEVAAEVQLTPRDRIDLLAGPVGIEVKIRGGGRRKILRQLERYAESDQIEALVLASGGGWPRAIDEAGGKRLFFASLTLGWL